jgi:hypothetical protein
MRLSDAFTLQAGGNQTQEKPTTPSGDTLDDTGQDNQRQKEQQQEGQRERETDHAHPKKDGGLTR